MKKVLHLRVLSMVLFSILYSCSQPENKDKSIENQPDKEAMAIQTTIDGLYSNIHVESGALPDFDILLSHFAPEARLGYVSGDSTILKTAEEYFAGWKSMMEQYQPDLLEEWEIKGTNQHFGKIAYHTSYYGVHVNSRDSLAEQGIINYQLVKLAGDWKVLSMIWQSKTEELTISDSYFE